MYYIFMKKVEGNSGGKNFNIEYNIIQLTNGTINFSFWLQNYQLTDKKRREPKKTRTHAHQE